MAYELLVLDVDGTLVNTKKEITERTKEALWECQDQGIKGGAQRASAIRQKRLDLTGSAAMLFRLMVDALQILQPVK